MDHWWIIDVSWFNSYCYESSGSPPGKVQQLDAEREQLAQKIQLLKVGPKGGTTSRSCPIVAGGCRRLAICIYTIIYVYIYNNNNNNDNNNSNNSNSNNNNSNNNNNIIIEYIYTRYYTCTDIIIYNIYGYIRILYFIYVYVPSCLI